MYDKKYIIITPAKNEAKYISKTIESVIKQTIRPIVWIIVDDGSTDETAEIVKQYSKNNSFIKLVSRASEEKRNFGNKVYAIRRGFEEIGDIDYQFYCNLDADVSFEPNYFEELLKRFNENLMLGICGGRIYDLINDKFIEQNAELHSVAGPVQFFRKSCYQSFGGYQPSRIGFIDGYAEISARMKGWKTETFPELKVRHYRPMGKYRGNRLTHSFEGGKIEYLFGYSYIYHLIRNFPKLFKRPFLIGYLSTLFGYHLLLFMNKPRIVNREFTKFVRKEQMGRIKIGIKNFIKNIG